MTERREGSTRIIEYRGCEIRAAIGGTWWRKPGGLLTEAKNVQHAMRAIDKAVPNVVKLKYFAPKQAVAPCSSDRARWRAAYNIPTPESD